MAVARTLIANCPERAPACPAARGQAITGGAFCASACPLILAAGVERLVGPVPMVGVHQITEVLKEKEGLAHLTTIKKIYEPGTPTPAVQAYLAAMGVGEPVMNLLRKTPASSIRWLSLAEIGRVASGDGGARRRRADPDRRPERAQQPRRRPAAPGPHHAAGLRPLAIPTRAGAATLEATFAYRRGGGVVGASIAARDGNGKTVADPSPDGWTLTLTAMAGEPERWSAGGRSQAEALIPRERFCALARGGTLVAAPSGAPADGEPPQSPTTFDLAVTDGLGAIAAEACP